MFWFYGGFQEKNPRNPKQAPKPQQHTAIGQEK